MKDTKPIFVGKLSLSPLKDIKEKVYLNYKGEIISKSLRIPVDKKRTHRQWYVFVKEYLDNKNLKYSIINFFQKDLRDIREMMLLKNQETISRNKIEDIVHWRNQIARIKDIIKHEYAKHLWKKNLKIIKNFLVCTPHFL